MVLDYFALVVLLFVCLTLFYGVIALHDIPYEIAKKRNHPHQDAIHVAGWVSLFTLHVIWPFLWIWATIYRPDRGYGFGVDAARNTPLDERLAQLEQRLALMERSVATTNAGASAAATATTHSAEIR